MLCRECLIDLNATKTAILAGCNVKIANRIVSKSQPQAHPKTESLKSKRSATKVWVLMLIRCSVA
ncbi:MULTISPECIES: hypothetical protein [Klebsiella]|uniref:hypothetical protein n=1 Tax=Klebsiella pneumoniae complex TaxID=3390273 RepID=UPI0023B0E26C|nr:hypothetical protein [Klebsiella pneumoniae]MDE9196942.1 hypothetical protein [Klebsiella pneumoniae]